MVRFNAYFWIGIVIAVILIASAFLEVSISEPGRITNTPILGLLIFYNPLVLAIYIMIALFFIYKGLKGKIKFV